MPRSSKTIAEDNDYALVSAVLFKRVLDEFKTQCRAKGFQVSMHCIWGAQDLGNQLAEVNTTCTGTSTITQRSSV